MGIYELILHLRELADEHGDLPIYSNDSEYGQYPICSVGFAVENRDPYETAPERVVID